MSAPVSLSEVMSAARRNRAPIGPESAGYIALAIADALARAPRAADAASCSLAEDGSVLVVEGNAVSGVDAERCVRQLLRRLLEASSGRAPALSAVAERPAQAGIAAVVREIEAALIPVNRGAARRSLARLARETGRAREELGAATPTPPPPAEPDERTERMALPPQVTPPPVARVAVEPVPEPSPDVPVALAMRTPTPPPAAVLAPAPAPEPVAPREPTPEPVAVREPTPEPAPVVVREPTPAPEPVAVPEPTPAIDVEVVWTAPPAPVAPRERAPEPPPTPPPPRVEVREPTPPPPPPAPVAVEVREPTPPPAPVAVEVVEPTPAPPPAPTPPPPELAVATPEPTRASADDLLASFTASDTRTELELARELKKMAGLEPTPAPPLAVERTPTPAAPAPSLEVPEPPALAERPASPDDFAAYVPRAPRATRVVVGLLLVASLALTAYLWLRHPEIFSGHR